MASSKYNFNQIFRELLQLRAELLCNCIPYYIWPIIILCEGCVQTVNNRFNEADMLKYPENDMLLGFRLQKIDDINRQCYICERLNDE
jgi:hypothetical protein